MNKVKITTLSALTDRKPSHALVANVDLVVIKYDNHISVLYGRCLHRGALLADGHVEGSNLICGLHNWDYRYDTGISEYNPTEQLRKFTTWIEDDAVLVDEDEIAAWESDHPQPYQRETYQGTYQDIHGTPEEPYVRLIQQLASEGLAKTGMHGVVSAMGVPRQELPTWDDLQFVTAQLHRLPQLDETAVDTELVIGP
ncbi:MAG: Rieske 2Fe-2S domain-containing protein, partial [Candidatus Marinimicrobia bacterium]|nr:Rieske 2Fe-2S domain-containing protein [Candidatus Neomarinimicrobiota bacterium]